jgi:hypothetical protein
MALLRSFPFGAAISCFAAVCFARPPVSGHPIIGTWNVVVSTTACQETWQFRSDGTTHNTSGSEESTSDYAVTDQPGENGFFALDDTITESNGNPDCGGSKTLVGDRAVVYLLPTPDGKFMLCSEPHQNSCHALMIRVSSEVSTPTGTAEFRAIDIGQSCNTVNAWEIAHGSKRNVTHADPPLEVYSYSAEELGRQIAVRYMCYNGKLSSTQSSFPREPWSRAVETYRNAYGLLKSSHGEPLTETAPENENSNETRSAGHWATPISVWQFSGTKLVLMITPNQPSKPELDEWHVTISFGIH